MSRATTVGLILCGAVALAQESKPELAPFPLGIVRTSPDCTKKDVEDLQKLLPMMLRAADASVPDSAKLSAALANLRRQDCDRDDACLAQLGKLAGSLYAFYAQVDFDLAGNVVASGRVVRDDGKPAGEPKTVKVAKATTATFRNVALVALKQLLVELDVAHLSPVRPQEPEVGVKPSLSLRGLPSSLPVVAEPVKPVEVPKVEKAEETSAPGPLPAVVHRPVDKPAEPLPAAVPVVTEHGSPNQRLAGKIIFIGGAALLISGLVSLGLASSDAGNLRPDANHYLPEAQTGLYRGAKTKEMAGAILLGIGAAAAIGGGALWLLAGQDAPVEMTIAPTSGGAMALFGGTF